jgi:protein-S-isoprenylcysteine O-methyltransferase Ste14
MVGVGLSTGNVLSLLTCTLLPLVGIARRIAGEEGELAGSLPGYQEYMQGRARLVPHVW